MTFGQKVKNRRKEMRLTQAELAEKTELSQAYISLLERGGFNPTSPVIIKLASALGTSVDYLLIDDKKAG